MAAVAQIDLQSALGRFGLQKFRKGQQEVIQNILAGQDCLCVMPTGGGKSLCYQLPSLVRPGLTIVVSPLIALMKDQVDTLVKRGISATLINSTLSNAEQNLRLEHVAGGHYSMVYVAPERLRNSRFLDAIRATPIQLLAIDEAHCISEWGHDFRPDYQRLGKFREALGGVQTVALTATATPRVREDIVDSLKLRVAKHFITGFARDNLYLGTAQFMSDREKDKQLMEFVKKQTGTGIIYASTRKRCEALVEQVSRELKVSVGAYHAGLLPDQRKLIQEQFMTGALQVIVATNAFGMGIDKSDLRYVVHYNVPGTLEAYYQEAGRAGRDGLPSQCVLLYTAQDRYIQEFFIENANPSRELLEMVYNFLIERDEDPIELTAEEIRELTNAPATSEAINSCLQILSRTTVMERLEMSGGLAMFRIQSKLATLVDLLPKEASAQRRVLQTVERAIGDRREEAVYIHPRWLMQQLQMDREALNRSLRELCKLECFEYVPPFRGRAIHFRRRDVAFADLKIDHETLAARKKADYEKLDQMVAYAQGRSCRQKTLLEYFGDTSAAQCGICDRCQGKSGWPQLPVVVAADLASEVSTNKRKSAIVDAESSKEVSADLNIPSREVPKAKTERKSASRKPPAEFVLDANTDEYRTARELILTILKAVEKTHGYLSKTLLTQHLSGTESKAVQGLRLQRLPEFGILKAWKKAHATGFLDQSIESGLMVMSELKSTKVTVATTDQAAACLRGTSPIPESLIRYAILSMRASASTSEEAVSQKTEKRLAPSRENAQRAAEPNMAIASVESEALLDPVHVDESEVSSIVLATSPISEAGANAAAGLDSFEIDPFSSRPFDQLPPPKADDAIRSRIHVSPRLEDWSWTLRLVEHGYRLGEIALIRGKTPDRILEDLSQAIRSGSQFSIEQLFDRRTLLSIQELTESSSEAPEVVPVLFQSYPSLWRFVQLWHAKCRTAR